MKKLSESMQRALETIERNGMRNTVLPEIRKTTLDALRERGLIEYVYRPMMIDATNCEKSERDAVNNFLTDLLAKKEYITEGFISYEAWKELKDIIKYEWQVFKINNRYKALNRAEGILVEVASAKTGLDAFDVLEAKLESSHKDSSLTANTTTDVHQKIEDGIWIESKYGTFITENGRFYMLEMTKAMTGQNARENALIKRRISKSDFLKGISHV
jgi:hypothetical protein